MKQKYKKVVTGRDMGFLFIFAFNLMMAIVLFFFDFWLAGFFAGINLFSAVLQLVEYFDGIKVHYVKIK